MCTAFGLLKKYCSHLGRNPARWKHCLGFKNLTLALQGLFQSHRGTCLASYVVFWGLCDVAPDTAPVGSQVSSTGDIYFSLSTWILAKISALKQELLQNMNSLFQVIRDTQCPEALMGRAALHGETPSQPHAALWVASAPMSPSLLGWQSRQKDTVWLLQWREGGDRCPVKNNERK